MSVPAVSRRSFVVGSIAVVATTSLPNSGYAAPAVTPSAAPLIAATHPAYAVDLPAPVLARGAARWAASGSAGQEVLDRAVRTATAYRSGILTTPSAPSALRALQRSTAHHVRTAVLDRVILDADRPDPVAVAAANARRPVPPRAVEPSPAEHVLDAIATVMRAAVGGAGREQRSPSVIAEA